MGARAAPLLVALLIVGCGSRGTTETNFPQEVTVSGRLVGGQVGDANCVWLEDRLGGRIEVFWPDGWSVDHRPVVLRDATGTVVAREEDVIRVTGFMSEAGSSLCGPGPFLFAERIEHLGRASKSTVHAAFGVP